MTARGAVLVRTTEEDTLADSIAALRQRIEVLERANTPLPPDPDAVFSLAEADVRYINTTGDTMTGALGGTTITLSGSLTAASGSFGTITASGAISGASVAASGAVTAGSAAISGGLSAGSVTTTGTVTANAVNAVTISVSGTLDFPALGATALALLDARYFNTTDLIPWGSLSGVPSPTLTFTGDATGSGTMTALGSVSIALTIQPNSVALGTDTTGDYVATVAGTANQVAATPNSGETAAVVVSLPAVVIMPGSLAVTTTLGVTGASTLGVLSAGASTLASVTITAGATIGTTLGVSGATTLAGLTAGATTLASLAVTAGVTIGTTLAVTGASTLAALSATTGTFSGAVSGTTGTFNSGLFVTKNNAVITMAAATATSLLYQQMSNGGATMFLGVDSSTGGGFSGSAAYSSLIGATSATPLHLATAGVVRITIDGAGATSILGAAAVTGATTFALTAGSLVFTSKTTGWQVSAAGLADFRSIFTDELVAKEFVIDQTAAYAGSLIVAKSASTLSRAFTAPAPGGVATLYVRDLTGRPDVRCFANGDSVVIRTVGDTGSGFVIADCVGVVSAYSDLAGGEQSYTFTRYFAPNAGAAATSTVFPVDAAVVDYGTTGQGHARISALDAAGAPYIDFSVWTSSPASGNFASRFRAGYIGGVVSGTTSEIGIVAGDWSNRTSQPAFAISTARAELHNTDLSLYLSGTRSIWLDHAAPKIVVGQGSNTITMVGAATAAATAIFSGTTTYAANVAGFWLDASGRLSLGNKLTWDGSLLTIVGTITATAGTIGGWTLSATTLTGTNSRIDSSGYISFGSTPPTSYGNNVGAWLGQAAGVAKFSLYSSATSFLQFDGTALSLAGAVTATSFTLAIAGVTYAQWSAAAPYQILSFSHGGTTSDSSIRWTRSAGTQKEYTYFYGPKVSAAAAAPYIFMQSDTDVAGGANKGQLDLYSGTNSSQLGASISLASGSSIGTVTISGNTQISAGYLIISSGTFSVSGTSTLTGAVTAQSTVTVTGALTSSSTVTGADVVAGTKSVARGYVIQSSTWDSPTSGTTVLYVASNSVTLQASRRYKVTVQLAQGWYGSVAGDGYTVGIEIDGVSVTSVPVYIQTSNQYIPPGQLVVFVTGYSAGSHTFRAWARRDSGTGILQFRGHYFVEDAGT